MTKNEIAKQINDNIKEISRQIQVDYLLDLKEDDIITVKNPESWTDGGQFKTENPKEFTYIFRAINEVPVHVVDYSNKEEAYELSAEYCEDEKEVLIQENTKFKVVYVAPAEDMKEIGFITVELEYIGDDENESD